MPKSEEQTKDIRAFTHLQLQRNRPLAALIWNAGNLVSLRKNSINLKFMFRQVKSGSSTNFKPHKKNKNKNISKWNSEA